MKCTGCCILRVTSALLSQVLGYFIGDKVHFLVFHTAFSYIYWVIQIFLVLIYLIITKIMKLCILFVGT